MAAPEVAAGLKGLCNTCFAEGKKFLVSAQPLLATFWDRNTGKKFKCCGSLSGVAASTSPLSALAF